MMISLAVEGWKRTPYKNRCRVWRRKGIFCFRSLVVLSVFYLLFSPVMLDRTKTWLFCLRRRGVLFSVFSLSHTQHDSFPSLAYGVLGRMRIVAVQGTKLVPQRRAWPDVIRVIDRTVRTHGYYYSAAEGSMDRRKEKVPRPLNWMDRWFCTRTLSEEEGDDRYYGLNAPPAVCQAEEYCVGVGCMVSALTGSCFLFRFLWLSSVCFLSFAG